jgi:hypothetical protein
VIASLLTRRASRRRAGLLALLVLWASPVRAQVAADTASMAPADAPAPAPAAPGQPQIVMTREATGKATVRAVRLLGDFALDGALTEEIYSTVAPLTDFVQQEPSEGAPATEKTEAWILFDDENIYVGARMHETEPDRRVAS